jgi:pimeloyl-ACP methyl ester carboxylesterase
MIAMQYTTGCTQTNKERMMQIIDVNSQSTTTAPRAARFQTTVVPPPGQLIDIGGYRLHLYGAGLEHDGPTIILEHGGGAFGSLDWSNIQPELAKFARVYSYDRAGYGWSDASPKPRVAQAASEELHALLTNAGVPSPYVLVAHSLGGYMARMYATLYPQKVAGMMLIDASHENTWSHAEFRRLNAQYGKLVGLARRAQRLGLLRLLGAVGLPTHPVLTLVPAEQRAVRRQMTYRAAYWDMIAAETNVANLSVSAAQVRAARRSLGDLPLRILSAGAGYASDTLRQQWLADQADLTSLSSRARQQIVPDATHFNFALELAPVTVAAVRELIAAL